MNSNFELDSETRKDEGKWILREARKEIRGRNLEGRGEGE